MRIFDAVKHKQEKLMIFTSPLLLIIFTVSLCSSAAAGSRGFCVPQKHRKKRVSVLLLLHYVSFVIKA